MKKLKTGWTIESWRDLIDNHDNNGEFDPLFGLTFNNIWIIFLRNKKEREYENNRNS